MGTNFLAYAAPSTADIGIYTYASVYQFARGIAVSRSQSAFVAFDDEHVVIYIRESGGAWTFSQAITEPLVNLYPSNSYSSPMYTVNNWLAISDSSDTIAVGVPWSASYQYGRVDIYQRSGGTWSLQQVVEPTTPELYSEFGMSVSLSSDGNTLAVGAPQHDAGSAGSNRGRVFFFTRSGSTWSQYGFVGMPSPVTNGWFGTAAALSADGSLCAITANRSGESLWMAQLSGGTWSVVSTYTPATSATVTVIGGQVDVALSNDASTVLLSLGGSTVKNNSGISQSNAGAAYLLSYASSTFTKVAEFYADTPVSQGGMGSAVAMTGDGQFAALRGEDRTYASPYPSIWKSWKQTSPGTWTAQKTVIGSQSDPAFEGFAAFAMYGQNRVINTEVWGGFKVETAD